MHQRRIRLATTDRETHLALVTPSPRDLPLNLQALTWSQVRISTDGTYFACFFVEGSGGYQPTACFNVQIRRIGKIRFNSSHQETQQLQVPNASCQND